VLVLLAAVVVEARLLFSIVPRSQLSGGTPLRYTRGVPEQNCLKVGG
jgi:hypothetical protein